MADGMSIKNRIDFAICEMKCRMIEPKSINLIESDYICFQQEAQQFIRTNLSDKILYQGISQYEGLMVTKSIGFENESFCSVIRVVGIPANWEDKHEYDKQNDLFNTQFQENPEQFIQFI